MVFLSMIFSDPIIIPNHSYYYFFPVGVRSIVIGVSVCLSVWRFVYALAHLNKKLSYHKGTARRAMLVNSCYVSRAMWVI